jgi:serine/threonine protein phosphatase 1
LEAAAEWWWNKQWERLCVWRRLNPMFKRRLPAVPDGMRIYAVGDIHGRADLLVDIFARIDADLARHREAKALHIFLGDYVDRGPSSKGVIDRLVERGRSHKVVCLKGNHESCLIEFLRRPATLTAWQQLGGLETLISYGLMPTSETDVVHLALAFVKALPPAHRRFLERLRLSFSCGDYFFVHAGIRPGVPLQEQKDSDLLWIRDDFLLCEDRFEKMIVHGHTPVLQPELRFNRINIDTGAYATGRLTCLIIDKSGVYVL